MSSAIVTQPAASSGAAAGVGAGAVSSATVGKPGTGAGLDSAARSPLVERSLRAVVAGVSAIGALVKRSTTDLASSRRISSA